MTAKTSNYGLKLVDFNHIPWHDDTNDNWRVLDAVIATATGVSGIVGAWENGIEVVVGEKYIDVDTLTAWEVLVSHTTPQTGTFEDARTAEPSYWQGVGSGLRFRGEWAPATVYVVGDLAYDSSEYLYGVCEINHVSTTSMRDDIINWGILSDAEIVESIFTTAPVATTPTTHLFGMVGGEIQQLPVAFTPNVAATNRFGMQNAGGLFVYETLAASPTDETGITFRQQLDLDYVGGTPGNVITNHWNLVEVGAGVVEHVWAGLDRIDNSGPGENVARYVQARRLSGAGNTWAFVNEVRDYDVNPTAGVIGQELDVWANGTDTSRLRIGLDIIGGMLPGGSGVKPEIGYGLRIGPQDGDSANAKFIQGIKLYGDMTQGIMIEGLTGTTGIRFAATTALTIGINLSQATYSTAPMRIAADTRIQLDATGTIDFGFESAGRVAIRNATVTKFSVDTNTGFVSVAGLQVLGARKTGWALDTGTAKRTANATYSGTASAGYVQAEMQAVMDALKNATETIKALKDDTHATSGHGIIGT